MLLHVVESSPPIDPAMHLPLSDGRREHMEYAFTLLNHIKHGHIVERAQVVRLPS